MCLFWKLRNWIVDKILYIKFCIKINKKQFKNLVENTKRIEKLKREDMNYNDYIRSSFK